MLTLKTTLRTISGPTQWSEVSTGLFQELIKNQDPVKRLSLLYNLNYEELMQEKSHALLAPLTQASAFIEHQPLSKELPETGKIKIGRTEYDIPKKLGAYTLGQAIQCRAHLEKCATYEEGIARATAIYMQPVVTNSEFDMDKVELVEQMVLVSPVVEVLGTGFFLLRAVEQIWKQADERMAFIQIPGADSDDAIAKMAGIERIAKLADLSIIDTFAQTYHLDPDLVYVKSFDTVMKMMILWKERERFQKTFHNLKKPLEAATKT